MYFLLIDGRTLMDRTLCDPQGYLFAVLIIESIIVDLIAPAMGMISQKFLQALAPQCKCSHDHTNNACELIPPCGSDTLPQPPSTPARYRRSRLRNDDPPL
jgi:hypothetical protein